MPKILLTDLVIRNLPAPDAGQETYWDKNLPGFGCRISQGGQKTFVLMYGPRESRRRKVVGKYPIISLKGARERARRTQAEITLGVVAGPAKKAKSVSFDGAVEQFLKKTGQRARERTISDYARLLKRHFSFGHQKILDITKQDLQHRLEMLDHVPSERKHADTVIRIFFNWAYREELIDSNPADRLSRLPKNPSRERVLSESELQEVLEKAMVHIWPFGPIVQLCVLTGQRRSEIGSLRWDWIDLDNGSITFPAEYVKNGRVHNIPLGPLTVPLIENLPQIDEFVFSGRNRSNRIFNGWAKSKRQFDETLHGVAHYTLHDLRRTFSTLHAKIGTPIHITERLLNHASGSISGVAAIYNRHMYLDEMRSAVREYEGFVERILDRRAKR